MKNKLRIIFQGIFLLMILYVAVRPLFDSSYMGDFEAYCPFGGLASIASNLELGSLSCQMSSIQISLGIGLLVGVIFFGKLFCSYVCPIGSITEWLGKIGEKFKIRMDLPDLLDRPLRALKYVLLFVTLYFTMTSSELFCKEYDPYFAAVNLFDNTDIVLYFAIPAFVITVIGTIIFRLFWCKYLCPLGALSNIFLNVIPVGAVIILFIILRNYIELSWIWLAAAISLIGLISEVFFKRSFFLPLIKITRNNETCTNCGICEAKCPQGIELTKFESVTDSDCNLCTDCVYSCPVKQSLKVNNKNTTKYLAPVATVILIVISLGFASNIELTTISEKWGDFESVSNMGVYDQAGLKNVKCFGSAMSLKSKIDNIPGIYGIDAYAASHRVKIYYDADKLSEQDIRGAIFTPVKQHVRRIKSGEIDSLTVWEVGIDNLFDNIDNANLVYALRQSEGVYGFETHFGEPVQTTIYYDEAKANPEEINNSILSKEIEIKTQQGTELRQIDFGIFEDGISRGRIGSAEYEELMFGGFDMKFNRYNNYSADSLMVLVYSMPEADHPILKRRLSYLTSHLSNDKGVVRVKTIWEDGPKALIFFDPLITDTSKIKEAVLSPKLKVTFRDGRIEEVDNPYKSKPEGELVKADVILNKLN